MTTRRNILKALAAIPFVGWVSKAWATRGDALAHPKRHVGEYRGIYQGENYQFVNTNGKLVEIRVPATKYGLIEAFSETAFRNDVRCWLDGIEVTRRATRANDIGGWADLFDVDLLDKTRLADNCVVRRHYGAVYFKVTPNLDAWKPRQLVEKEIAARSMPDFQI